ncbi:hypothetical protein [Chryseobacterium sp.]|uniref:hypothetical protein n=1 Tax=Chryseobacterium sp. TaxID=1871047 RepID=UPI00262B13D5|nr:hypothetical protein [Chryseobacterium sp.]
MTKSVLNILFVFLLSCFAYAQNISIIKDSICTSNECLELQEMKMSPININVYKKIQKSYDIFDGILFDDPEKRLNAKKDTLKRLISTNSLRDSQFGFEKYKIFFDKNGLLNLSVNIQSYGSPWEDAKYYLFDNKNNIEVGEKLFLNKEQLLKLCLIKLKVEEGGSFFINNLTQYKIKTNNVGKVEGISFIFYDEKNRTNSGYLKYPIFFTWKEIENFIVPQYRRRLSQ